MRTLRIADCGFGNAEPPKNARGGAAGSSRILLFLLFLLFILFILFILSVVPGAAQTVNPDHGVSAKAVAHDAMVQLRSPVTPSHTLDMCPSPEAAALRDTVLLAAAGGRPANLIVEDVISRRGEELRIVPRKRGFGLWAWLAPPAVLLLGGAVVLARLRSFRATAGSTGVSAPAELSAQDRTELASALRDWERAEAEV